MPDEKFRIEKDSMGEMKVPRSALWGAQTQRAVENFPVSSLRFPEEFIHILGMLKMAAARTNVELNLLDKKIGEAIAMAAGEVIEGKLDDQFVVDIFQTGSGTSTNMNANEVIAGRANQILQNSGADAEKVHPNDHVNMGQSSNDVIPTCIHIAALEGVEKKLLPELGELESSFQKKSEEFADIIKIARTHLQDAVPVTLGQEFSGYAMMLKNNVKRLENTTEHLSELPIGGTAVGTGLNTHPEFAKKVIEKINDLTGLKFLEAENHFEAQASKDAVVEASSALKTIAVSFIKIANDIRWLGSGPRCGIGEIKLPEVQPGSSIMPGKVNPVIAESLLQVSAQVIGNDAAVAVGGLSGNFELNVMMPVMAYNLLQSIAIMTNAVKIFREKCIDGIQADRERCGEMVEKSLAMVTALSPHIGYDKAAEIAKEAYKSGKTIREVVTEKKVLPQEKIDIILNPLTMTKPK